MTRTHANLQNQQPMQKAPPNTHFTPKLQNCTTLNFEHTNWNAPQICRTLSDQCQNRLGPVQNQNHPVETDCVLFNAEADVVLFNAGATALLNAKTKFALPNANHICLVQ